MTIVGEYISRIEDASRCRRGGPRGYALDVVVEVRIAPVWGEVYFSHCLVGSADILSELYLAYDWMIRWGTAGMRVNQQSPRLLSPG